MSRIADIGRLREAGFSNEEIYDYVQPDLREAGFSDGEIRSQFGMSPPSIMDRVTDAAETGLRKVGLQTRHTVPSGGAGLPTVDPMVAGGIDPTPIGDGTGLKPFADAWSSGSVALTRNILASARAFEEARDTTAEAQRLADHRLWMHESGRKPGQDPMPPGMRQAVIDQSVASAKTIKDAEKSARVADIKKMEERFAPIDYVKLDGAAGWFQDVVEMAPQVGVMAAANVMFGPLGSAGFIAKQIFGGTYDDLTRQGVQPRRALAASLLNATLQTPLEQIGFGKIARAWKPQKTLLLKLRNLAETMGTEWLTEIVQKVPELITTVWAKDPNMEKLKSFTAWADALKEGFYEGSLTAPFGLLGLAAPVRAEAMTNRINSEAKRIEALNAEAKRKGFDFDTATSTAVADQAIEQMKGVVPTMPEKPPEASPPKSAPSDAPVAAPDTPPKTDEATVPNIAAEALRSRRETPGTTYQNRTPESEDMAIAEINAPKEGGSQSDQPPLQMDAIASGSANRLAPIKVRQTDAGIEIVEGAETYNALVAEGEQTAVVEFVDADQPPAVAPEPAIAPEPAPAQPEPKGGARIAPVRTTPAVAADPDELDPKAAGDALGLEYKGAMGDLHIYQDPVTDSSVSTKDLTALEQKRDDSRRNWAEVEREAKAVPTASRPIDQPVDIQGAYQRVAERTGYSNVNIADVIAEAGADPDAVKEGLLEASKAGSAVLSTGDWSVSDDRVRSGAINLNGEPHLMVRMLSEDASPKRPALPATEKTPDAASTRGVIPSGAGPPYDQPASNAPKPGRPDPPPSDVQTKIRTTGSKRQAQTDAPGEVVSVPLKEARDRGLVTNTVRVKREVEGTGKIVEIEENAADVRAEIDGEIKMLKALKDCV